MTEKKARVILRRITHSLSNIWAIDNRRLAELTDEAKSVIDECDTHRADWALFRASKDWTWRHIQDDAVAIWHRLQEIAQAREAKAWAAAEARGGVYL